MTEHKMFYEQELQYYAMCFGAWPIDWKNRTDDLIPYDLIEVEYWPVTAISEQLGM